MSQNNKYVFGALHIIAWIIFVGLSIETGGVIVNFIFSIYNPGFIPNLYLKMDLMDMYDRSRLTFFGMYSFILCVSLLKVYLFYIVVMLMHKMDLSNPFSSFVSDQISKISYFTFSIGMISFIARQTAKNIQRRGYDIGKLNQFWEDSQAFILMAAVVYIIAIIFKKGVEIQNENSLTV